MKKIIAIALITMAITASAYAQTVYTTKGGYIAGVTKQTLETAMGFISANDDAALQQYLDSNLVIALREGVRVYVVDTSWGLWKIRPVGSVTTVWVPMEAVR